MSCYILSAIPCLDTVSPHGFAMLLFPDYRNAMFPINCMKPAALFHLMTGKILRRSYVLFERKDQVTAHFDEPVSIEIDGEIYENLHFDIQLIHDQLRIFRP